MRYDRPRTIRGRSTANYGNPYDNTPSIGKTIEDVPSGTNITIMTARKNTAELVTKTVANTVATESAATTVPETVVIGNVSYPKAWVQPTKTFSITSIVENKKYVDEYDAMDEDTKKTHPSFKLGIRVLTTDEAKLEYVQKHTQDAVEKARRYLLECRKFYEKYSQKEIGKKNLTLLVEQRAEKYFQQYEELYIYIAYC